MGLFSKKYTCSECGDTFNKSEMDEESLGVGYDLCQGCAENLARAGRDAVDPDHNFDSYEDWDEMGR